MRSWVDLLHYAFKIMQTKGEKEHQGEKRDFGFLSVRWVFKERGILFNRVE